MSRNGGDPREIELFREPTADEADEAAEPVVPPRPSQPPPSVRPPPRLRPRRVLAIAGAKGGAGKSIFAANLAIYLATIGRKVVVVDADPVGANLHTCLGVDRPRPLTRRIETAVPGLTLMHAGMDEPPEGSARRVRPSGLATEVDAIEGAEWVVVDAGAGTDPDLLDFVLEADISVYITLPEPTAIENFYRFIRFAYARHLRRSAPDSETRKKIGERLRAHGGAPAPLDLVRRLAADGDELAEAARLAMNTFSPRVVLNQARVRADLELGDALRSATWRRLGIHIDYLGYVDFDDTVWSCVRMRRPLLVESPGTKASKSIEKIARRILAIEAGKARGTPLRTSPPESHHDLLEVDRGATDEEIRRAYKRMREIYAPDALCCYGLFDAQEMIALRARLDEAYDVLLDPARRRPYELSVFPPERDPSEIAVPAGASLEPKPDAPVITPETEFTGPLLRLVRESQGVRLEDVSQRTKIGLPYLKALEDDDYSGLPAMVYARGFVTEYAKALRLDPTQVSRTYIRRFRRWLDDRGREG
jgi:flagellar biosynthesis protein FlhG